MNTFLLNVSSPDGDKFKNDAVKIILRGTEGDLAVLAGHIPFITSVKPCVCKIEFEDGSVKTARTDGGLLTVSEKCVTLLTGYFEMENNV